MKNTNIDFPLMLISLAIVVLTVVLLAKFPIEGTAAINDIFTFVTNNLGSLVLWFGFFTFLYCLYMAFGKYGKIKLGEGEPEFTMFQYLSMMICAGLGSACVIWSFTEWVYYYQGPALGIEPLSNAAAEWATAYNLFHWGFTPWAMFLIATIPVAYGYHVRKIPSLRFSSICAAMMGETAYTK